MRNEQEFSCQNCLGHELFDVPRASEPGAAGSLGKATEGPLTGDAIPPGPPATATLKRAPERETSRGFNAGRRGSAAPAPYA